MAFLYWKLCEMRAVAGITQAAAAEKAGMSASFYADFEHGRHANPSLETMEKLASVFKVGIGELVGDEKPPKKAAKRGRGRPKKAD